MFLIISSNAESLFHFYNYDDDYGIWETRKQGTAV